MSCLHIASQQNVFILPSFAYSCTLNLLCVSRRHYAFKLLSDFEVGLIFPLILRRLPRSREGN